MNSTASPPEQDAVQSALKRVLASAPFAPSPRASRFLRYAVEAGLAGRRGGLKEQVLGISNSWTRRHRVARLTLGTAMS